MSTKVKVLVVPRCSKACKILVLLEHVRLGVLAEEGSKVQVSGHKLLLHILQCPLMFHDLQRLPLTLRETNRQHESWWQPDNCSAETASTWVLSHLKSLVGVRGHRHGSTSHLLLHDAWLVSSYEDTADKCVESVCVCEQLMCPRTVDVSTNSQTHHYPVPVWDCTCSSVQTHSGSTRTPNSPWYGRQ